MRNKGHVWGFAWWGAGNTTASDPKKKITVHDYVVGLKQYSTLQCKRSMRQRQTHAVILRKCIGVKMLRDNDRKIIFMRQDLCPEFIQTSCGEHRYDSRDHPGQDWLHLRVIEMSRWTTLQKERRQYNRQGVEDRCHVCAAHTARCSDWTEAFCTGALGHRCRLCTNFLDFAFFIPHRKAPPPHTHTVFQTLPLFFTLQTNKFHFPKVQAALACCQLSTNSEDFGSCRGWRGGVGAIWAFFPLSFLELQPDRHSQPTAHNVIQMFGLLLQITVTATVFRHSRTFFFFNIKMYKEFWNSVPQRHIAT